MAQENDTESKSKQLVNLIISVGLLILILVVFILYLSWPLLFGHKIVLETVPVDPFDIFRGQYLTIRYNISTIPALSGVTEGQSVYVALRNENGIGYFDSVSLNKPDKKYFIKGTITKLTDDTMNVKYGIEQYFFEKDADVNTRNMTAEVMISSDGRAKISRLLRDGKQLEINYSKSSLLIR